ncbi:MAG: ankyrin repeat domain-containing protein [Pseudomonas sp.]|nr:ankyrin repeat domain-containing protein [Pseudomonas sp.]
MRLPFAALLLSLSLATHAETSAMNTPLLDAARHGDAPVVRQLLDRGALPDTRNDQGQTALLVAEILGDGGPRYVEIVRRLLAAGADPRITDKEGVTALEHARQRGYREVVTLLEQ